MYVENFVMTQQSELNTRIIQVFGNCKFFIIFRILTANTMPLKIVYTMLPVLKCNSRYLHNAADNIKADVV